jgi:hypothetical protein
MTLTISEEKLFKQLEKQFEGNYHEIRIVNGKVEGISHYSDLVETDEQNSYEDNFIVYAPGDRSKPLGKLKDYNQYLLLKCRSDSKSKDELVAIIENLLPGQEIELTYWDIDYEQDEELTPINIDGLMRVNYVKFETYEDGYYGNDLKFIKTGKPAGNLFYKKSEENINSINLVKILNIE